MSCMFPSSPFIHRSTPTNYVVAFHLLNTEGFRHQKDYSIVHVVGLVILLIGGGIYLFDVVYHTLVYRRIGFDGTPQYYNLWGCRKEHSVLFGLSVMVELTLRLIVVSGDHNLIRLVIIPSEYLIIQWYSDNFRIVRPVSESCTEMFMSGVSGQGFTLINLFFISQSV